MILHRRQPPHEGVLRNTTLHPRTLHHAGIEPYERFHDVYISRIVQSTKDLVSRAEPEKRSHLDAIGGSASPSKEQSFAEDHSTTVTGQDSFWGNLSREKGRTSVGLDDGTEEAADPGAGLAGIGQSTGKDRSVTLEDAFAGIDDGHSASEPSAENGFGLPGFVNTEDARRSQLEGTSPISNPAAGNGGISGGNASGDGSIGSSGGSGDWGFQRSMHEQKAEHAQSGGSGMVANDGAIQEWEIWRSSTDQSWGEKNYAREVKEFIGGLLSMEQGVVTDNEAKAVKGDYEYTYDYAEGVFTQYNTDTQKGRTQDSEGTSWDFQNGADGTKITRYWDEDGNIVSNEGIPTNGESETSAGEPDRKLADFRTPTPSVKDQIDGETQPVDILDKINFYETVGKELHIPHSGAAGSDVDPVEGDEVSGITGSNVSLQDLDQKNSLVGQNILGADRDYGGGTPHDPQAGSDVDPLEENDMARGTSPEDDPLAGGQQFEPGFSGIGTSSGNSGSGSTSYDYDVPYGDMTLDTPYSSPLPDLHINW